MFLSFNRGEPHEEEVLFVRCDQQQGGKHLPGSNRRVDGVLHQYRGGAGHHAGRARYHVLLPPPLNQ